MPLDELLLVTEARAAADDVLGSYLRLPVAKALDVGTRAGFDRAVAALAARLRRRAGPVDEAAVKAAMAKLDVDWTALSVARRKQLIAEAVVAAGGEVGQADDALAPEFERAAEDTVVQTRRRARTVGGLAVAAALNALDRRIIRHVRRSQAVFVQAEYATRATVLGEEAARIVAEGMLAGFGRADIARDLQRAATAAFAGRSAYYWEVVAASAVSTARSMGQISSMAEAGVERYVIEATLDEVTTDTCRFLHGKTFSVGDALRRFERIEAARTVDELKAAQPWVRQATDPDSGRSVLYVERSGRRTPIAEVARSGFGNKDDVGEFRRTADERAMLDMGVSFPPFHDLCRSCAVAAG